MGSCNLDSSGFPNFGDHPKLNKFSDEGVEKLYSGLRDVMVSLFFASHPNTVKLHALDGLSTVLRQCFDVHSLMIVSYSFDHANSKPFSFRFSTYFTLIAKNKNIQCSQYISSYDTNKITIYLPSLCNNSKFKSKQSPLFNNSKLRRSSVSV